MPQKLCCLHTSPTLTPMFGALCAQHLPDVNVFHMVDESLIKDTVAHGHLRKLTIRRLFAMVESAFAAGSDAVLVTCSSIGEGVALTQRMFDLPVVRIDDAMAEAAIEQGSTIGVLATLRTTLEPTIELVQAKAAEAGKKIKVVHSMCPGAFDAVLAGDVATHDRIVSEALLQMNTVDAIVLAQASMARVVATLPKDAISVPVLSSPELAVLRVRQLLRGEPPAAKDSAA